MNNKNNKSTTSLCANKNINNRNYKIINNNYNKSNSNNNNNTNNSNNNNKMRISETRKYWVDVQQRIVSSHGERDPL